MQLSSSGCPPLSRPRAAPQPAGIHAAGGRAACLPQLAVACHQQRLQQVTVQAHHQALALGVTEAHIVFQQLGLRTHAWTREEGGGSRSDRVGGVRERGRGVTAGKQPAQ